MGVCACSLMVLRTARCGTLIATFVTNAFLTTHTSSTSARSIPLFPLTVPQDNTWSTKFALSSLITVWPSTVSTSALNASLTTRFLVANACPVTESIPTSLASTVPLAISSIQWVPASLSVLIAQPVTLWADYALVATQGWPQWMEFAVETTRIWWMERAWLRAREITTVQAITTITSRSVCLKT